MFPPVITVFSFMPSFYLLVERRVQYVKINIYVYVPVIMYGRRTGGVDVYLLLKNRRWKWCVVNTKPQPLYNRKRSLVPLVEQDVWTSGPVWAGVENMMWLLYLFYGNKSSVNRYEIAGFDNVQQSSSCVDIRFHGQCIGQ